MESEWSPEAEQARFSELWQSRRHSGLRHTVVDWNERADNWDKELRESEERKARSDRRVNETAAYLRTRGLLQRTDEVIDIGCGPGRFAAEFAKTAGHVTGVDLSPHMAQYGAAYAAENGLENVSFLSCDFKTADIEKMGWKQRFDLVFASITPAMSDLADLDKAEAISRAFCFSSTFVRARDTAAQAALSAALPGAVRPILWDGRSFYAMFNLLWLRGRYPQVSYYKESDEDKMPAGKELALRVVERLPTEAATDAVIEKVYRYFMERADVDGMVEYPMERWYGWLLWDVRDRDERDYAYRT